jgi:hypothetical protein
VGDATKVPSAPPNIAPVPAPAPTRAPAPAPVLAPEPEPAFDAPAPAPAPELMPESPGDPVLTNTNNTDENNNDTINPGSPAALPSTPPLASTTKGGAPSAPIGPIVGGAVGGVLLLGAF